jgi:hypothetical protein
MPGVAMVAMAALAPPGPSLIDTAAKRWSEGRPSLPRPADPTDQRVE